MKICISAESTIDLPENLLNEYEIQTIPFGINLNDELINDEIGVSKKIFEFVDRTKALPKTSAVSPEQYNNFFSELKQKYDAIIHISISSQMSCAYNNACLIAREMENVYVVDSKTLSTGIALLAIYAKSLVDKKMAIEDIVNLVTEKAEKTKVSFVLDKLNYMHKGGRCSSLTLISANILKIRPQIVVENGRMSVGKKYRGVLSKVIEKYSDDIIFNMNNVDKNIVFVTRSSDMIEEVELIKRKLKDAGFVKVFDTYAGGTICSHCGPGCLGILYMEN